MQLIVKLDWKSFAAIGLSIIGIFSVKKMDPEQVEEVSIHAIDACKEVVPAFSRE